MSKELITKFNGGNPVILCSNCRTIIKYHYEFDEKELSEILLKKKSMFCEKCKNKK